MNLNDITEVYYNDSEEQLTYEDYTHDVKVLCVGNESDRYFVIPDWREILRTLNMMPDVCEVPITLDEVRDILVLEAARLNRLFSPESAVFKTLVDIFNASAEETAKKELVEKYLGNKEENK